MDNIVEVAFIEERQLLSNMETQDNMPLNSQQIDVETLEIELKTHDENNPESYVDPLQESSSQTSYFQWLFNDDDVVLRDADLTDVVLTTGKGRCKRGRSSNSSITFISSNGRIWNLERKIQIPLQKGLTIPKQQAFGKGPARTVSNAVESWMLLFDDEMLRMLLRLINEQIRKDRATTNTTARFVDLTELRSWLGLKYLCGVFRNAQYNGPLDELWTLELGNTIFRATMSLERFEFIANCLSDRSESCCKDVHNLWQKLLINCRSYYGASGWLCADAAVPYENALIGLCCDARTLYMTNALIIDLETKIDKELLHLICDYKTTGRNITLGARYANVDQCEQLLQYDLSSLCSLHPSSLDYPKGNIGGSLLSGPLRLTYQSGVALLTCGMNHQLNASQVQLNTSQACVRFQELSNRYSTALSVTDRLVGNHRNVLLDMLHLMLNVASVNAWILLRLSPVGDVNIEQRDFQRQLGLFLTQQRLQRRLHHHSSNTTLAMRLQICEILGQSSQRLLNEALNEAKQSNGIGVLSLVRAMLPEDVTLVSRYGEKHRRCKTCARNKREIKARSRCQQCQAHRCGNHLISRCYECTGVTRAQIPEENIQESV